MRIFNFITTFLLVLIPMVSGAQSLTNKERRELNTGILNVIKEYDRFASLYDEESEYYFLTMFESENVPVFCDILGSPKYMEDIPVYEYVKLLKDMSANTTVEIRDVRKGQLEYKDGEWLVPVHFRKSISYMDSAGYLFSVENFHDTDVNMTMNLIYDEELSRCIIRSITGHIDSDKVFPKERFIILNQDKGLSARNQKFYESLTVNGEMPEYNQFGQAILSNGEAQVDDPDVEVIQEIVSQGYNYDVVSYRFKSKNARVRLRYSYSPYAYLVKNDDSDLKTRTNAMEFGLEFGYALPSSSNMKMSINTGVGLSMSNLRLNYDFTQDKYYYYSTASYAEDKNGLYETFKYKYSDLKAYQHVRYMDLFVPVYLEFEHRLGKYLAFTWNVGAKGYYALSAEEKTPYDVTGFRNGETISLMENSKGSTFFIEHNKYNKKPFDVSVMANLGLDINLMKNRIYLMIRGGYEYGLLKAYESHTGNPYCSASHYPVIYDPYAMKDVAVHSLMTDLSFRRGTVWISTGVKFKL